MREGRKGRNEGGKKRGNGEYREGKRKRRKVGWEECAWRRDSVARGISSKGERKEGMK